MSEITDDLLNRQFNPDKLDSSVTFRVSGVEKGVIESTLRASGFKNIGSYFLSLHRWYSSVL